MYAKPARIVIQELSRVVQPFLHLQSGRAGVGARHFTHAKKFDEMARLAVEHCVILKPCLTSRVCFSRAEDVLRFLTSNCVVGNGACHKKFLTGRK